ncbi:MAG TPA: AMP-binding protein [Acidimicrobiales bacterium]|nr:AMP-binding protein [Acidimicrobiales bacterium]
MAQESPRPSLAPYPELPVSELLAGAAERWPDDVALVDGITDAEYTFARVWETSRGVARALQDEGVEPGDRVGIVAPNSPEWIIAFHGAQLAGATVTTLNPLYKEREIAHQFGDSEPKAVFVADATAEVTRSVWGHDERFHHTTDVWSMAEGTDDPEPVTVDPAKDLAALPYSSGTTGAPKGVMLTHHNITSNVAQIRGTGIVPDRSVMIDFLPFFHIYGLVVLQLVGLASGSKQVVLPGFDPQRFLDLTQSHRATNLFVVPPALLALANLGDQLGADLSSVRYVMSGAAPLPIEVARRVSEKYEVEVVQGYGMTEASPVTHISLLGEDKPGTVGPPVADTRQKVVDLLSGEELGVGETGELLVQGPQVMAGYLNRPDATEETLLTDDDGVWLRTGDIVTVDDDAYVTIRDRAKEMIKYKGYQIAPAELEAVLMEHADVADAAVIPKDSGNGTDEIPKAFVVLREGAGRSADEVMAFVEERVAAYKKVREVEFIDAIPKNPSGKILRRELKDKERASA